MTGILEKNHGFFRFLIFLFLINLVFFEKQSPEVFYKKGFLKILQSSEENTCIGVSVLKGDPDTGVSLRVL